GTRMRGIDPGVMVDDDGRVYIALPKPFRLGELDPDKDYAEIKEGSMVYVQDLVTESPDHHFGFEGPSLRKFGNLYYFIYIASEIGQWRPVRMNYLISENIHEGWRFGGTIIDTVHYLNGVNVHGSVEKFGEQLYLSYHRLCPGVPTDLMREMHMERVSMDENGHFMQTIITSSGVRSAFDVGEKIPASTAVWFSGGRGDLRFMHRGVEEPVGSHHWTFPAYPYAWFVEAGQYNGYRYLSLDSAKTVSFRIRTTAPGAVLLLRNACDQAVLARVTLDDTDGTWETVSGVLAKGLSGRYSVCVELETAPTSGQVDFDWFCCHP
ncbi:MAG: family 43 glycosylhydrolase, partial [Clostridia bacterium]|nr:family 43 glycosylhydrolase [Clostridia bacterium]